MQGWAGCGDAAAVAGCYWVHEIVVDVAVEDFGPGAGDWESDVVVVPGGFGERGHYDDILSRAFQPAVIGDHAVRVVDVEWIYVVAAQGWMIPAQAD